MFVLHETYHLGDGVLDDFEDAYWSGIVPGLATLAGIAPLWLLRQRAGTEGAVAVALVALRRGEDLGAYDSWRSGPGGVVSRLVDQRLSTRVERKVLVAAPWSPLRDWDEVASTAGEGSTRIFMEDTGWPYAAVSDYVEFQRREYWEPLQRWTAGGALLKLWGFFLVAPGTGRRPEAVFLQEIVDPAALEALIGEPEEYDPETFPGSYMVQGLDYRDQWRSRLLVASGGPTGA